MDEEQNYDYLKPTPREIALNMAIEAHRNNTAVDPEAIVRTADRFLEYLKEEGTNDD